MAELTEVDSAHALSYQSILQNKLLRIEQKTLKVKKIKTYNIYNPRIPTPANSTAFLRHFTRARLWS